MLPLVGSQLFQMHKDPSWLSYRHTWHYCPVNLSDVHVRGKLAKDPAPGHAVALGRGLEVDRATTFAGEEGADRDDPEFAELQRGSGMLLACSDTQLPLCLPNCPVTSERQKSCI